MKNNLTMLTSQSNYGSMHGMQLTGTCSANKMDYVYVIQLSRVV